MILNVLLRGYIEQTIDETIQYIPTIIADARSGKARLHIKEENDYVLGLATGYIYGRFETFYRSVYFKPPSNVESSQTWKIIFTRLRDIRDVIYRNRRT
jgi:hypothetical protein